MDANRIEYLTLTYQLFMRIRKGLDDLCVAFSNYIKVSCMDDSVSILPFFPIISSYQLFFVYQNV